MKNQLKVGDRRTSLVFPKELVEMIEYVGQQVGIRTFTGVILYILTDYLKIKDWKK